MKTTPNNPHFALKRCIFKAVLVILPVLLFGIFAKGSSGYFVFLFVSGWLIWTFLEYVIHRFLMHELIVPGEKENLFNHQHHHQNPQDMAIKPLHRFLFLALALASFVIALKLNNLFVIFSGFMTGFLLYNFLHFLLHQPYCRHFLPRIQRAHILHHTRFPNKGFSFSTILWDWLFDSLPPRDAEITEKMLENFFGRDNYSKSLKLKTSSEWLRKYIH
jgi:sterol desaturase/sphingolipid hydroxylase (fatty acid hydroxylase superfamily)